VRQLWDKIKSWNKKQIVLVSLTLAVTIALAGIGRIVYGIAPFNSQIKSDTASVSLAITPLISTAVAAPVQSTDGTGKTITHAGETVTATERPPNAVQNKVQIIYHTISPRESLWTIAKKYQVTTQTILAANPKLDAHTIKPGITIRIPNRIGLFYKVAKKQSIATIAKAYRIKVEDILQVNGLNSPNAIKSGDTIFLPGEKPLQVALNTNSGFMIPVRGRLTSRFGYRAHPMGGGMKFHTGLDIAADYGATVVAAESGKVVESGWHGLLGKVVIIRHSSTYETLYGHNSYLLVRPGEYVKKGEPISRVGSTGLSTGPHVHFEVHKNGTPVNPLPYLR
jgi:LysM repeat protein